jgi:predicted dehydrogenase
MTIGLIGNHSSASMRRSALERPTGADDFRLSDHEGRLERLDVVFVASDPAERFELAEEAIKRGLAVFVEWPPAASAAEVERLAALADESRAVVGVSRPLRNAPGLKEGGGRLISIEASFSDVPSRGFAPCLSEAADTAAFLAGTFSTSRVDGDVIRGYAQRPIAAAFGLRLQNGAYATIRLFESDAPTSLLTVWYGQAGDRHSIAVRDDSTLNALGDASGETSDSTRPAGPDHGSRASLLVAETHAFLAAVRSGGRPPVSIFQAVHSFRLNELLMRRIR